MNSKEIIKWLVDNDVVIEDVIDAIIEEGGIIGVGLITLADNLTKHIHSHIKPATEEELMR
jgi:hypothetical protein|tara:strand:- start:3228 stop:3410 length:183 start_codon:yes stop_codon:yes gene_type:complete